MPQNEQARLCTLAHRHATMHANSNPGMTLQFKQIIRNAVVHQLLSLTLPKGLRHTMAMNAGAQLLQHTQALHN